MNSTATTINSKGTVLIVDDTPANLAVLSDMLSEAGFRVLVATDGISALEQIKYLKPDIILLDVVMPGIDGFETCHRLKSTPETANIPIIFMTGLSELEDLLKGFEQGAVDYIVKPIRPPEVLARVEAQLSQSHNLLRAERVIDQLAFAALSFDKSGMITWITATATKALYTCIPELNHLGNGLSSGDHLPKSILGQMTPLMTKPSNSDHMIEDLKIGDRFTAKIIPCHQASEFMLLIQKSPHEWDLSSLKSSFGLTVREAEILMWISRGKTNKEVGLILETSPRTVNKHLEHVFEKLGVPTRTAAVAKVLNK